MTHIEAKSINIWLRYDPKCNLAICKDSGVKYELWKQFTSVKLYKKKLISGVSFDISNVKPPQVHDHQAQPVYWVCGNAQ